MAHAFRFLDDIALADIAFDAEGDSLEELIRGASEAVIETMADPATVGTSWGQAIECRQEDPAALLFDWLSAMVYHKDADGVVFHHATLTLEQMDRTWVLRARLVGAPVNYESQELRNDVKGVTKHLYAVTQTEGQWKARVVLDV